jgi:hypothetical protein
VIVSGDSDFSPLVNKLRENAKTVIGVGVKSSSSHLLIDNCDEFIYYDDLVRDRQQRSKRAPSRRKPAAKKKEADAPEDRREEALELVVRTAQALLGDRGEPVWGSQIKQTLKRKRPNFLESYHGYRSFNELLEDASNRELLRIEKDERSGGYVVLALGGDA